VAAAMGLGVVLVAGVTLIPPLAGRLGLFGETGVFRLNLWRASINMFLDHPLFGVGLDNFLYEYRSRYIFDAAWREPNLNHPHNILLDFATRLGVFGLLAGGWMVWEAVRALQAAVRRLLAERQQQQNSDWLPVAVGLSGALAAMLAHGLVDHSFFLVDLAFVFYFILGTAVWLNQQSQLEDTTTN
jgi:O-antigen ligase